MKAHLVIFQRETMKVMSRSPYYIWWCCLILTFSNNANHTTKQKQCCTRVTLDYRMASNKSYRKEWKNTVVLT